MRLVAYSTNSWVSPLAHLRILSPANAAGLHVLRGTEEDQIYPERVSSADLVLVQRDFPRHTKPYEQILNLARQQGKPLIYDLDDLLLELPDDHPDRLNYYYDAALLPMVRAMIEADLVTVSTEPLKAYCARFNPHVHVLPNLIDERIWKLRQPVVRRKENGKPVVLAYMGGPSHTPDLNLAAPALRQVARRYGSGVRLFFLGARPPVELLDEPNVAWQAAPTFDYQAFAEFWSAQSVDVCYAPLRDNLFNRCKSAVKYLEYSAVGAAGVYSALEPYQAVVRDGENGLLASSLEDWERHLSALIESPELRFEIASRAQDDLRSRWLVAGSSKRAFFASQRAFFASQRAFFASRRRQPAYLGASERSSRAVERATKDGSPQELPDGLPPLPVELLHHLAGRLQQYHQHLQAEAESQEIRLETQRTRLHELESQLRTLQTQVQALTLERDSFSQQLWAIEHSRPWQAVLRWRELRSRLQNQPFIGGSHPPTQTAQPPAAGLLQAQRAESAPADSAALSFLGEVLPGPGRYDVFVLPILDWEGRFQRPQQLALQFARAGHRVFYLSTSFNPDSSTHLRRVAANVYELHLHASQTPNLYREQMDRQLVDELYLGLQALQQKLHILTAVTLVELPFWAPLAQHLRSQFDWPIVYDCMDEHAGFTSNTPEMLALEQSLVQTSDLVLVTSHRLMQNKSPLNPHTVRLPNGADYLHFRFPVGGPPAELAGLQRPIIGYYGAIADWFDSSLVAELAQARPDWSFVLIGSTWSADLLPLEGLQNIHLLGEKPYHSLPPYLHAFDAAIIPFKKTPLTQATNPVKLFEYLSAGKPVVASHLDELQHYSHQAQLANELPEWLVALEQALQTQSPEVIEARREFARQNTWEIRFWELQSAIAAALPKVSLVLLTYNNLDYTRLCLDSIFSKTEYPNYEVIVVDNASSDGTPQFLQEMAARHTNLRLALNAHNAGFAGGNNQGAALADGEIIIFLNNDTVVSPGWMAGLVRHLRDRQVGLVGPVTNSSGNESRIEVDYQALDGLDEFAARRTAARFGQRFEIPMLAFLCVAIRRSVFQEIGPLDETFGLGTFEDDDYALRVRSHGYRIVCAEDVFVHHWGSASFSKLSSQALERLYQENRRRFEAKWGTDWRAHRYRQD